jgi:uncharacterized membrane protein
MSGESVTEGRFDPEPEAPTDDLEIAPLVTVPPQAVEHTVKMELVISSLLRYGVLLSFVVILAGSILLFVEGGPAATVRLTGEPIPKVPSEVIAQAFQGQPKAIIDLGLFLLIATPVARVAVAFVAFLLEADYVYTLITFYVLAMLVLSFLLGRAG